MEPEIKNPIRQLYTFDNLPVLRSMDSDTVDLIYLDPPFNQRKIHIGESGDRAPASFKEAWELSDIHADEEYALSLICPQAIPIINDLCEINGDSWKAYLIYMSARLVEMQRILKPSGSIYYHCDSTMSHGVKLIMDSIFGGNNLRNEIIWSYHRPFHKTFTRFIRMHDVILFYSKTSNNKYNFLPLKKTDGDPRIKKGFVVHRKDSKVFVYDWEKFNAVKATLDISNYQISDYTQLATNMGSVWTISPVRTFAERLADCPTQKPLALLERIIKVSSNKGDLVLEPFCSCATACLAAEHLERQWIGIDLAKEAVTIAHDRLRKEGENKLEFATYKMEHLTNLPKRSDLDGQRSDDEILKSRLHDSQGGKCLGCDKETHINHMYFDRIIAKSRGGQDTDNNIQLLCHDCNTTKESQPKQEILERHTEKKMREYETKRLKRAKDRQQD